MLNDVLDPNNRPPPAADTSTAASAPGAEGNTEAPTAIDINEDINIEMSHEEIHSVLRSEWGDRYASRLAAAERLVGEVFHNDKPLLNWFAERLGSHVNVVRLTDRLDAMLNGNRPARAAPAPNPAEVDAQLKEFQPGGSKHEKWISGDSKLNAERIALYSRKHPGSVNINDFKNFGIGINK